MVKNACNIMNMICLQLLMIKIYNIKQKQIFQIIFNQMNIIDIKMFEKGGKSLPKTATKEYKTLAKFYDTRNYKKGLKHTQKLLQEYPNHPQTNSMKALFQLGLGQLIKAQITAKDALQKSMMKSMFCWHTYGTVLKQRKKFNQATFCFQQVLNFQKDNIQVLKQTASLQIQIRDHNSHVATRLKILQLKPNAISHWASFAIANHLKGDYQQLYKILHSIQNLDYLKQMKPIQISHYLIYRIVVFQHGCKYDKMYEELIKNKQKILDLDVWHELMLKCSKKLNKINQINSSIQFLLKKYPQNIQYMKEYQDIYKINQKLLYQKIRLQFKSKIAKIYQICYIEDKNQFKKQFIQFIKPFFQKNLISLFSEIQVIYQNTNFQNVVEEVLLQTKDSLKEKNAYIDGTVAQFPTEYLWSLYLLSQHYSRKFVTLPKALQYINMAIEHTSTVTEFYIIKAEIQYKMHKNVQCLKTIDEARKTDLADRYMNNICIKYLLKCMKPSIAQQVLKLFMRDQSSLYQLQNQWYIIQAGKSYLKLRNFPAGLRHLNFIQTQFYDMLANQYDFHNYCTRKWTLKQYLEYIQFNDNIYKDNKYVQAVGYAIQYLFQYVHQLEIQATKPKEEKKEVEEKKKNKKKNKPKQTPIQQLPFIEQFRKKIDYFGKQYAQKIKAKPLEQALTYAKNVTSSKYINKGNKKQNKLFARAFANAITTFIYFNKPMLVAKSLKKLIKTMDDPFLILHSTVKSIIYFQAYLLNSKSQQTTKQFIKQYLCELLGDSKTVNEYFARQIKNLPQTFNRQIRIAEIQLCLNKIDSRQNMIKLYKSELQKIIETKNNDYILLEIVFYLCHKLQFYGQFTKQLKDKLQQIYSTQTQYFKEWHQIIHCLHKSSWGIYWLSDYDKFRQPQSDFDKQKVQVQLKNDNEKKDDTKNKDTNDKNQLKNQKSPSSESVPKNESPNPNIN